MRTGWIGLVVGVLVSSGAFAKGITVSKDDLRNKLPKQTFAPVYATIKDAAKSKQANQLNTEGYVFHAKKDFAKAEAKYLAALAADPGHVLARYNLACIYNLMGQMDKGLALLVELQDQQEKCTDCGDAVEHARFDNDWQTAWDKIAFWQVETAYGNMPAGFDDDSKAPKLKCPAGASQVSKGFGKSDTVAAYCQKGGAKHGPSFSRETGYDLGEGATSYFGEYRNGKKSGLWTHFESYGENYYGAYVDDVKHGLWVTSHKDHQTQVVYVKGKQQGYSRTIDGDDAPVGEENYVDDTLQGAAKEYARDDKDETYLAAEGAYDKGKKHGHWVKYDGPKRISEDATYDHDKPNGEVTRFVEGKKIFVGHYELGGVKHGSFEYWWKGKSLGKAMLDHGAGDWIDFKEDVVIAKGKIGKSGNEGHWLEEADGYFGEGDYAVGKRTGAWTLYVATDHKLKAATGGYTDGKQHGAWQYFDDKGAVRAKGAYAKGVPDGEWKIFEGGKAEPIQTFVMKGGKLATVEGKKASKAMLDGWKNMGAFPDRIEEWMGPPM